jgi:hypothetical protein
MQVRHSSGGPGTPATDWLQLPQQLAQRDPLLGEICIPLARLHQALLQQRQAGGPSSGRPLHRQQSRAGAGDGAEGLEGCTHLTLPLYRPAAASSKQAGKQAAAAGKYQQQQGGAEGVPDMQMAQQQQGPEQGR